MEPLFTPHPAFTPLASRAVGQVGTASDRRPAERLPGRQWLRGGWQLRQGQARPPQAPEVKHRLALNPVATREVKPAKPCGGAARHHHGSQASG